MTGLPQGWAVAKGEQLFELVRGVTYDKTEVVAHAQTGFVGVLRATNIQNGEADRSDLVYVPSHCVSEKQMLQELDLLIATSSGSRSVVGKLAEIGKGFEGHSFGAFCSVARPVTPEFSKWVSYFSKSRAYRDYVEAVALGTNINNFRSRDIDRLEIPLPPLPEQRRIVRKLDTLSARSTTARTHLTAIERLVERYKESLRQQAFVGVMSASWREHAKHDEDGSVLLDHIRHLHKTYWLQMLREKMPVGRPTSSDAALLKKYQAPERLTETDQPHGVPQTWTWAAAEEIVEPGAEIVYGIVQPGPRLENGIPYVRGMDIVNGVIQTGQLLKTSPEIAQKYERASLRGNDILLGIIRATKVAIVPPEIEGANITQGTARFRPSCVISTEFLAHWLSSKTAQSWLHAKYRGIDMPGLNLRDVRRVPVPLPPLEEQREIVRRIETAFAKIDRLKAEAAKALKLLGHLDQRILAKAFAGNLVPQDPTDEPAETLLTRIREARAKAQKVKRGRKSGVS